MKKGFDFILRHLSLSIPRFNVEIRLMRFLWDLHRFSCLNFDINIEATHYVVEITKPN